MTSIDDLAPVAVQLNEESDELNERITNIQDRLQKLQLGVECWLEDPVMEEGEEDPGMVYEFGYAREGKSWALLLHRADGYRVSLHDASRALRILVAPLIPKLLAELKVKAEATVQTVRRTKKLIEDVK